jgi:hypothetical protein
MYAVKSKEDRRRSPRRLINRVAKIQLGNGTLPCDCLITDISTGGVRLHVEGFEVPDDFVCSSQAKISPRSAIIGWSGGSVTRSARGSWVLCAAPARATNFA